MWLRSDVGGIHVTLCVIDNIPCASHISQLYHYSMTWPFCDMSEDNKDEGLTNGVLSSSLLHDNTRYDIVGLYISMHGSSSTCHFVQFSVMLFLIHGWINIEYSDTS